MEKPTVSRNDLSLLIKILALCCILILAVLAGAGMFRLCTVCNIDLLLCLVPMILILLLIPALFLRKKKIYLCVFFAILLAVSLPLGITVYDEYIRAVTVDTNPVLDYEQYLPFQEMGDHRYGRIWSVDYWDDFRPQEKLTGDLPVLDGAQYVFPLYSGIVNAIYPETTVLGDRCFRFSGETEAFQGLLNGTVDIYFGMEPTPEQLAVAEHQGIELILTPVAKLPWYIIIHRDNPVTSLTENQLRDIFSGQITNWSQVGGKDELIQVYQNEPGSEAQRATEQFMNGIPMIEPITETVFDFSAGFREQTAKFRIEPGAIGFGMRVYWSPESPFNTVLVYKDDGQLSETTTTVYAVTRKDSNSENINAVLDFITGPEGQYMAMFAGCRNYYYDSFPQETGDDIINTAPNIILEDFMPFYTNTNIVKLDHEASLRLTTHFPRIDGAAAVFPVYSAFVRAVYPEGTRLYNNDKKDLDTLPGFYFFNYSNTVKGYKYLAQKDTDIFFGTYPSEAQIAYARENGTEFVYTPIGHEAFVFFVHKDNPIDSLTSDQIRAIYSGEITNWSQVGGLDEEIVAYQRNEGSGSQSRLIRFMGDVPLMEAPVHTVIDTMMGITHNVAQFRNATTSIGFSFRYYMETLVNNPDLKLLAVDGIAPTKENIRNGTYPLTGTLYAVSWEGNENENVQALLDWILSPEGQYIIEETGYVAIGPIE